MLDRQDRRAGGVARVGTRVLHAVWSAGKVHLWSESATPREDAGDGVHPCAHRPDIGGLDSNAGEPETLRLRLPGRDALPSPSATMALARGLGDDELGGEATGLVEVEVPTIALSASAGAFVLERMLEGETDELLGPGAVFLIAASRLAREILVQQRFVPMVCQLPTGELTGQWRPWLSDEATAESVLRLVSSIPGAARSAADESAGDAWGITESFVTALVDQACRAALIAEDMGETIEDLQPASDEQVAWLSGLLGVGRQVPVGKQARVDFVRHVRRWIGGLEERGISGAWRLGFRLHEPLGDNLPDTLRDPDNEVVANVQWSVSFFLQSQENPDVVVEGADVWLLNQDAAIIEGLTLETPQELVLGELARATRHWKPLEAVLDESEPIELALSTSEAYAFLREIKPILVEQGFAVTGPSWWDSPTGRLGARLRIDGGPMDAQAAAASATVGLGAMVGYHWEIAIGDTTLSLHEFEQFAGKSSPLVRINGKWVEVRPEDVQNAIKFISENPGGEMELGDAMRLAFASDPSQTGLPVVGLEASGWVAELFGLGEGGGNVGITLPQLEAPRTFLGTLRPYQTRGLSWLAFMEQMGFGACLADDMGLGKTVQLLALLAHEREAAKATGERVGPTLLIVPMSVVGNWVKEVERFTPTLKVLVHHGVERLVDQAFVDGAEASDLIVTTYALAHRDRETLERVQWGRLVLDEAQFVKNPAAKQSQAVRSIPVARRVALTGTPVENRLSELWSIMDFLNPGYLGQAAQFRRKFAVPIERYRDEAKGERLRQLVRPFILRRVKTDPTVVADLPEKLESKEYCHLSSEQAQLYESCVKRMLSEVERAEGIHRRGLVLSALIKLKQICNHPAQLLKDADPEAGGLVDPGRSGKCVRVMEMLDEILSEGDRSLVFTQFRQMGHILAGMMRHKFGREILFLHGGTPQAQRQKLIDKFQDPQGPAPVLILSLKAGGVGLNLTAATHVIHFDRWWNPAVENQATDRAYRIGQTRTVQVHKFVVRGTLEERIDEMIEQKTELAENIIGHGERWLTELDGGQLRDILTLRADAVGDDEEGELE
ncbi:MAG: DEAD/DEAH box helicase [Planctomycetota bacterium]